MLQFPFFSKQCFESAEPFLERLDRFLAALPAAVPTVNLWLGGGKGVVFGALIALVACHFGLRIKPNTESLGEGTTTSVVTSITSVILADAVFAIIFNDIGISLL